MSAWSHVFDVPQLFAAPSAYDQMSNSYLARVLGAGGELPSDAEFVAIDWLDGLFGPTCYQCPAFADIPSLVVRVPDLAILVRGSIARSTSRPSFPPRSARPSSSPTGASWRWPSRAAGSRATPCGSPPSRPRPQRCARRSPCAAEDSPRCSARAATELATAAEGSSTRRATCHCSRTTRPRPVPSAPAAPRNRYGLVLSGSENALFVIGGLDLQGQPVETIERIDIDTGLALPVRFDGPAPGKVLAATFRPNDRSLFVLDEVEVHHALRVRLLRIDLGTLESVVLVVRPRQKHFDRVFLSNAPRGELLVAASNTQGRYRALRLQVGSEGAVVLRPGFRGQGKLALAPVWTDRGLSLMLERSGTLERVFRSSAELVPEHHDFEDCL